MTTRDPRSRNVPSPTSQGGDGVREPTQSLSLDPDEQASPAELALGTHNRPVTRIESPAARGKTPAPPGPRARTAGSGADDPADYLDAVLGSYRVLELLGKGGMGYVFRAEHIKLGREVALKLLRSDYASRRDAVARFFQEARTVNRVRHRNIVDVTDFVELDDGTTYIVMELLTGTSLGTWAQTGIDLPRALAVLIQICDGLGAAHQVGVVHRDLKPDNVIIVPTSDGAELVKLLDFGVAKLLNRDDEDVGFQTAAGSVIGTPAYMSPEQAGGMVVDARSDIYSLGAIMYELFCGEPLFRGRSFGEFVRKHLTEMPVPPHQTPGGAQIDPRLEALILRCLDKDPEQRFSYIVELRDALLQLLGGMEPYHSLAGLTASGLRLPVTPLVGAQLPPGAPMAPPISGMSGMPGQSGPHPAQLAFNAPYGYLAPPETRPSTARPWWVWFAGGAAAVGLGIAAAIWVAGRRDRELTPRPAHVLPAPAASASSAPPTAQPIEPPPPPAQLVEVRFDSLPSGGVFAEGSPSELCHTPCAFDIDLSDGGPGDRRTFIVKRSGYVDSPVTVDLTGGRREFQVVLEHVAADPVAAGHAETRPRDPSSDSKIEKIDTSAHHPGKRPARPARASKDAATRDAQVTRDPRDADADHPSDPAEPAPAAPKQPGTPSIDPADTLDPFRKK